MKDTVYLYVFDGLADWEIGYLTAELGRRELFFTDAPPVQVTTVGQTSYPVLTMGGLKVLPDITIDEVQSEQALALILPGGDSWLDPEQHRAMLALAGHFLRSGVVVGAICAATAALIKSGLVGEKKHTSNDLNWLKYVVPAYKSEVNYQHQRVVTDGNLITASGTSPLEFTVHVLAALKLAGENTLETWLNLNRTNDPKYFYALEESLNQ